MASKTTFNFISVMHFIACLLISLPSSFGAGCNGPRNVGELTEALWGEQSQYSKMKYIRPNVSKLDTNKTTNSFNAEADNRMRSNTSSLDANETIAINPLHAEPDIVTFKMTVLSVKDINQQREEVETMILLRQQWNDHRLQFKTESQGGCFLDGKSVGFDVDDAQNIWTPHVVLTNLATYPTKMASSFWIYPNGMVVFTEYLVLKTMCKLDLSSFPLDKQSCSIVVGSWRDGEHEVKLGLSNQPITIAVINKDTGISNSLEWNIEKAHARIIDDNNAKTPQLVTFTMDLNRESSYYSQFVIFPVVIMIVLSWASFFIGRDDAPARVAMSIICFLAITNFTSSQFNVLPRLGGNKVWLLNFLLVSMGFSCYAVLESVICNYLRRVKKRTSALYKKTKEAKSKRLADDNEKVDTGLSAKTIETTEGGDPDNIPEINALVEQVFVTKADMEDMGGLHRLDSLLLKKDGTIWLNDEMVEVFSRWMYPITYTIACCVLQIMKT